VASSDLQLSFKAWREVKNGNLLPSTTKNIDAFLSYAIALQGSTLSLGVW
jgi:hypothetical protein